MDAVGSGVERRDIHQLHGGNIAELRARLGLAGTEFIDFSVNVNPLGPPASVKTYVKEARPDISVYPDPQARALILAAAGRHMIDEDCIIPGAGAAELLYWLVAYVKPARVAILEPTFGDYFRAAAANGAELFSRQLKEANAFAVDWNVLEQIASCSDMFIVGHPNNPTGRLLDKAKLIDFVDSHPDLRVIVDEAFVDFAEDEECSIVELAVDRPNLISLRSLTKVYSMPNLRLGYLVGEGKQMVEWREARPPWPLGEAQLEAGRLALNDTEFLAETRRHVKDLRESLAGNLREFSWLSPMPSDANFLLVKIASNKIDDQQLLEALAAEGVIIRACRSFAVLGGNYFRVAVRSENDNRILLAALKDVGTKYGLNE